jgi:LAO/AO transport system kinase
VAQLSDSGRLTQLRSAQAVSWMRDEIRETLLDDFRRNRHVAARWDDAEAAVRAGKLSPTTAARTLLDTAGP